MIAKAAARNAAPMSDQAKIQKLRVEDMKLVGRKELRADTSMIADHRRQRLASPPPAQTTLPAKSNRQAFSLFSSLPNDVKLFQISGLYQTNLVYWEGSVCRKQGRSGTASAKLPGNPAFNSTQL